jgi:hypothetical protein
LRAASCFPPSEKSDGKRFPDAKLQASLSGQSLQFGTRVARWPLANWFTLMRVDGHADTDEEIGC